MPFLRERKAESFAIERAARKRFNARMAERQLHLFEPARPLLERFGDGFFRAVPPRPGVYVMGGEQDRVLYIGQSRNLRARLGSYKNARSDRAPRKVIRLVHAVRSIVWEECPTAAAAKLKENCLLRTHRPRFNRMNTWPRAYRFVTMQCDADRLTLTLTAEPAADGKVFGAFKGTGAMWGSLLRLIWAAWHQAATHDELPACFGGANPPKKYTFLSKCCGRAGNSMGDISRVVTNTATEEWARIIEWFFTGVSDELLQMLARTSPKNDSPSSFPSPPVGEKVREPQLMGPAYASRFQANLQTADLEALTAFYLRGPRRMRQIRNQHGVEHPVVPQEEVDDWLVLAESKTDTIVPVCK
jgi:hypothetical protein